MQIGSSTAINGDSLPNETMYARLAADYEVGSNAHIVNTEIAVSGKNGVKLGIRMDGNTPALRDYTMSRNNHDAIMRMKKGMELAVVEVTDDPTILVHKKLAP